MGLSRGPGTAIKPASPDGYQGAYNGVRELYCASGLPPKVKARTATFSTEVPGNNHTLAEVVSKMDTISLLVDSKLSSGGISAPRTLSNNDSFVTGYSTLRTQKAGSASKRTQLLEPQRLVPERPPAPTITTMEVRDIGAKPSGLDLPASTIPADSFDDIGVSPSPIHK